MAAPHYGANNVAPTFVAGKFGNALSFTGSSEFSLNTPADFQMTAGSSWTVEMWVKTTQTTGTAVLVGYKPGSTDWAMVLNSGVPSGQVNGFGAGGGGTPINGPGSIADGNWHHLAIVVTSGTSLAFYVDGVRAGTTAGTYAPVGTGASAYIGTWGGSLRLTGSIDEVAVWDAAKYSGASFTPPTTQTDNTASGLRVCFHFDAGNVYQGDNKLIYDCAGSSFSVSPTSGANGASLTFTGTGTQWSLGAPPAFTITGSGNSISTSVSSDTAATGTLTVGTNGAQTITDASSSFTRAFTAGSVVTPPGAPMASVATNSSGLDVVSYTAATAGTNPIAGYALYAGTTSGGESATPVATVTGSGAGSFTGQTTPTPGNAKYYYVKAYDNAGTPNYSSVFNEVSTTGMAAGTLSNGTIASSSYGLSWTAATNPSGTISYQVQRAPDVAGVAGSYANIGSPQAGTTYTDSTVSPSTKYWYRVVATDQASHTVTTNAVTGTTTSGPSLTFSGPSYGTTGVASTNFTVVASSAPGTNLTVSLSDSGGGGTFTPASATILAGQTSATFTYTPGSTGAKTLSVSASGYASPSSLTYTSLSVGTYFLSVAAPYGSSYTGQAVSLGFTVYSPTGSVLLARTTGSTYECGVGTGLYVCNVPVDSTWSGIVVVDAPSGAVPYVQPFQAPTASGGSGVDPWSVALPGSYANGTAGRILANLALGVSVSAGGITSSSFASGAIDANAIATDAFGSLELSASAVVEIATACRDIDCTSPAAGSVGAKINQAAAGGGGGGGGFSLTDLVTFRNQDAITTPNVADCLAAAWLGACGNQITPPSGSTTTVPNGYILYGPGGLTPMRSFTLIVEASTGEYTGRN